MAEDTSKSDNTDNSAAVPGEDQSVEQDGGVSDRQKEIGGRDGPDPTRYGDWEKNGRCIDF
jgi:hypothetical protein